MNDKGEGAVSGGEWILFLDITKGTRWTYMCDERERGHMNTTVLCMRVGGWVEMKSERGRARRRERKGEIVLSYDERLDWLESDDCSKWPGRWFHLCFPFSLSLMPSSSRHLLSHLHLSLAPCLSLSPPLPGFIMATHQRCPSLSPNGTAISTNAFRTYSSCHITIWGKVQVFLRPQPSLFFLSSNLVSLVSNMSDLMSTRFQISKSGHDLKPVWVIMVELVDFSQFVNHMLILKVLKPQH